MQRKNGRKFYFFISFLGFSISLLAAPSLPENTVYIVTGTVIHGFENINLSTDSHAPHSSTQERTNLFIYVEEGTIFTAPNYVLDQVVFIEPQPVAVAREGQKKISSDKEKIIIYPEEMACVQTSCHPFGALPIKNSEHFKRGAIYYISSSIDKIFVNAIAATELRNNFIFNVNEGRNLIFSPNANLRGCLDRQYYTTRPPPILSITRLTS